MKAFLLHGKQDIRIADLEIPTPEPGQVVLQIRRAGICGSDIHYFSHGKVGSFIPKRPFVLGHEFAGEIISTGEGVSKARIGERVSVDPSIPCGSCRFCRMGRYNLCQNMKFFGSASCDPHLDGGFEEFVAVPAANCYVLPDSLGWGEAAMIEPLSVAIHAVERAGSLSGRTVLITGGGTIGQLIAQVARAYGAEALVLSDLSEYPRKLAVELGADAVLDAHARSFEDQAKLLAPGGFDVVFEAAGSVPALHQGLMTARRGATIVQVGTLPAEVTLPLNMVMARELDLIGSFRFANVFERALKLAASGRIHLLPLISAVLPLGEMPAAMQRAVGKNDVIKIQVEP